jgi:hypothetical protein
MYVNVEMNSMADIRRINEFACKCDFDVFVEVKNTMVDAKSILGLVTVMGKTDTKLVIPDHIRYNDVQPKMKKFKLL